MLYCHAPDMATPLVEQAAAFDKHYRDGKFEEVGLPSLVLVIDLSRLSLASRTFPLRWSKSGSRSATKKAMSSPLSTKANTISFAAHLRTHSSQSFEPMASSSMRTGEHSYSPLSRIADL